MIGLPQSRTKNLFSAENVERQIAIVVVVAVEEASFLSTVQRQIGGVHVQDDLRRSASVRLDEHLHQKFIQPSFPESDLLVPVLRACSQFHPIQRALARQRLVQFLPPCQNAEHRVVPQLVVIVEIFVSQRQTVDPLRDQLQDGVLDQVLVPSVEKTPGQTWEQIQALVGLAQQQRATVGTDRAAIESGHNLPRTAVFKSEAGLGTLCHSEGRLFLGANCCLQTQLCHGRRPFANSW